MVAVAKKKVQTEVKTEKTKKSKPKVISNALDTKLKKQAAKKAKDKRGLILIRNLPHGFFEEQLKEYFSQFGKVTRIRLARSKRTTRSRGYAFIEFQYPEVAEIAAEAMNNYMMFKKLIKTVNIPPAEQKYNYFKSGMLYETKENGQKVLSSRFLKRRENQIKRYNRQLTDDEQEKRLSKTQKKMNQLKNKLEKYNIDYDLNKVIPDSLKGRASKKNVPLKNETEESDSEMDDSLEPEKFGFVADDSDDDEIEDEENELDSDVSDEPNPKLAAKKKTASVLVAKQAVNKLIKKPVPTKKATKKVAKVEIIEEKPMKKQGKKLIGIEKKQKKAPKFDKQATAKLKRAVQDTIKKPDQVKVVQKKDIKTKRSTRK